MSAQGINLLLVEANAEDTRAIRETLNEADIRLAQVTQVEGLADALTVLGREEFDVILLDLALPNSRGLATIEQARTKAPHAAVVVLAGFDDEALALMALQLGAQDYLLKGRIDPYGLARTIHYAIQRQRTQAHLVGLALIDELTGLYNRRGFLALADQHLKLARRTKSGLWLLVANVDGLKTINATFGHREGDQALVAVGELLRGTFRESDIIARLGGDEFALLAVQAADDSAGIIRGRLQRSIEQHNAPENRAYTLSLSFGLARFDPDSACALDELMIQADDALHAHKRNKQGAPRPA